MSRWQRVRPGWSPPQRVVAKEWCLVKIQIIQHTAADSPATAGDVLEHLGHQVEITRIDRGDAVPSQAVADGLMMFGGGASFTGGDPLPSWVEPERELIRRYNEEGKRIVGICFGSQLLASALGASVHRNRQAEVGWHPIAKVDPAPSGIVTRQLPDEMTVFHWHQDTFEIPDGAQRLYCTGACDNQAFVLDDRVFGFQFHLEANERTVRTFLAVSKLWRQSSPSVQSEAQILGGIDDILLEQQAHLKKFLMALFPPELQ